MSTSTQYRNTHRILTKTTKAVSKFAQTIWRVIKRHWKVVIPAVLLISLLGSGIWFFTTKQATQYEDTQEEFFEVAFVDARQAVIFWKTDIETIGFVRYGTQKNKRDQVVYQTSSTPGYIHAVVIENLPLEGVYISLHHDDESTFRRPRVQHVVFDEEAYLEAYYAE